VQSPKQPVGGPGLLLMGGGTQVNAAFTQRVYPIANVSDRPLSVEGALPVAG